MKKIMLMVFLAFVLIAGMVLYCLWDVKKGGPDETVPPWLGLSVKKHDGIGISIGSGYITIVKENSELWIWGVDKNSSESDARSEDAWKLTDNVAKAIPLAPWSNSEDYPLLGILHKNGSFWIWNIAVERNALEQLELLHFMPAPEKIMSGVSDISVTNKSFYALKTNHSLWGIGVKIGANHESPYGNVLTTSKKYGDINTFWVNPTGNSQVYMLTKDGDLLGFGENEQGQLGVGFKGGDSDSVYLSAPRKVTDSISSVITMRDNAEFYMRTMAIKEDNSLWLWGYDIFFSFPSNRHLLAVPVKVMDNAASGAMSSNHALIVKQDGSLWTWGFNKYGQLGTGNYKDVAEPVKVMDDIISVYAGFDYSIALQNDGTLWAWGNNEFGQLGTGDTVGRTDPVEIMKDVTKFEMYSYCNVAVKDDGSVWLWGNPANTHGYVNNVDYIYEPVCILR